MIKNFLQGFDVDFLLTKRVIEAKTPKPKSYYLVTENFIAKYNTEELLDRLAANKWSKDENDIYYIKMSFFDLGVASKNPDLIVAHAANWLADKHNIFVLEFTEKREMLRWLKSQYKNPKSFLYSSLTKLTLDELEQWDFNMLSRYSL